MILLGIAGLLGWWSIRPESESPSPPRGGEGEEQIVLRVNGEPIPQEALREEYAKLREVYRRIYAQSGRDLDQVLREGAPGAYLDLQIRYQAAQRLIDRALIRQEAERRGLRLPEAEVVEAAEERYRRFLETHGVREEELVELFRDPEQRRLTQQLLGIRDESVEALRDRFLRETEDVLIRRRLARALLGPDLSPDSEEGQARLDAWLEEQRAQARVEYLDPLLWAYDKEARMAQLETPEAREQALEEAIAAYRALKERRAVNDPYLDFYIAQLYQMRVSVGQAREQELRKRLQALQEERAAEEADPESLAQELSLLEERIEESRERATEFFLSAGVDDERQMQALVMADPNNPFYLYMYARMLLAQPEGLRRALRLLPRALEIDPQYVDAYALLGDLERKRERYTRAIELYRQALEIAREIEGERDAKLKMLDNDPLTIRRKIAEAYLALARRSALQTLDGEGEAGASPPAPPSPPSDPEAGRALAEAERLFQEVREELAGAEGKRDPMLAAVWAGLGEVAYLRGEYEKARARYERSLALQDDDRVRTQLAETLLAAGDLDASAAQLEILFERSPRWAPAHWVRARLLRAQGRPAEALEAYKDALRYSKELGYLEQRRIAREALRQAPEDAELQLLAGHIYLQNRVYSAAAEQYRRVLTLDPTSVAAHGGLGRVALERRDFDAAIEHFRQALALSPTLKEEIGLYELLLRADRERVGPGAPLTEEGQEALFRLAELYLRVDRPADSYAKLAWLREQYPDFRRAEVTDLWNRLAERAAGQSLPGEPVPDQGHATIAPGDPHPPYNSKPPTSGPHYPIAAAWGVHARPVPDEVQVRNLAGGGVLIQYRPDLDPEVQQRLRDLVEELRSSGGDRYCRLLLAPYEDLPSPIVLTAWTRIDRLEEFDRNRILRFIDAFIGRGPEVHEVACTPPSSPEGE